MVGSVIAKLRSEAREETQESGPNAGCGDAECRRQLGRVQSGDVAQRDERAIVRGEAGHRVREVDVDRPAGWIWALRTAAGAHRELHDRTTAFAAADLTGLIGRDRDEPRSD